MLLCILQLQSNFCLIVCLYYNICIVILSKQTFTLYIFNFLYNSMKKMRKYHQLHSTEENTEAQKVQGSDLPKITQKTSGRICLLMIPKSVGPGYGFRQGTWLSSLLLIFEGTHGLCDRVICSVMGVGRRKKREIKDTVPVW